MSTTLIDHSAMHNSMAPSDPISPVLARACDLSQEIIRKRGALRKIQIRLGTSFEKPDDLEQARRFGHELKGLVQEKSLAIYLFDKKSAAPEASAKKSGTPNFNIDEGVQWVGRTI